MPVPSWETLRQDAAYALRGFRRSPVFALTALLALALGIGATTAVFSVVDRILFRPLPYAHAGRLVSFGMVAPLDTNEFLFGADYFEMQRLASPFEAMGTFNGVQDCDLTDASPVRLRCATTDASLLETLGVRPVLGRWFTSAEDQPQAPRVALATHGLWLSRFGGDPAALGRTFPLDGQSVRLIGVLPPDFELPTLSRADLLLPQALDPATQRRPNTGRFLRAFARLKPGITPVQAEAASQPLFRSFLQHVPAPFRRDVRWRVQPLRDRQAGDARSASWTLLAAVAAVLLIACANVANLLLARGLSRQRELAVRAALGAGRWRLARQALTESLLLAACGGVLGCALAYGLLRLFVAMAPAGILRLQHATLDGRALGCAVALSLLSALLFGLAPALQVPPPAALAGVRTIGQRRGWFRQALVAAQVGLSVVLLVGAGLLLRSLWNLQSVPLGLETEGVVTASVALSAQRHPQAEQQAAFFRDLEGRLRVTPGLLAVAVSDTLPPGGLMRTRPFAAIRVDGRPPFTEGTGGMVGWRLVTPGYFQALRIPIVRGRGFVDADRTAAEGAVILSESLARKLFPNENPLGQRILDAPWWTVVGVAANAQNGGPALQADPEFYLVRRDTPDVAFRTFLGPDGRRRASVIVRSTQHPDTVARWLRATVAAVDPLLPVSIETMEQRVAGVVQRPRFQATLLTLFAAMGLLLAAVGLYGVMAFLVAQQTQEIGVRMALGATGRQVMQSVMAYAGRWVLGGAVLGMAGAAAASRWLQSMLFRVPAVDPWVFGAAVGVLFLTGLAAAWLPARRAARVDPLVALRNE